MHLPASEAIGLLDKTKWANTTPQERLKLLEQMQEHILEEMEDLGVEEAEMKNMKVGTTDNLYAADACRLTAVIPIAFAVSSAIDLYKTNLSGKTLNPVKKLKVEEHNGVDMIDFGVPTPDASHNNDDEEEEVLEEDKGVVEKKEDSNGKKEDDKEKPKDDEKSPPVPSDASKEEPNQNSGETPAESPPVPSDPPPVAPSEPPPEPPSAPPPPPPAAGGDQDDNKENTAEQETTDDPAAKDNASPPEPSDPPPVAPSEPPPEPPSAPPPPPPGDDNDNDDDGQKSSDVKENGETRSEKGATNSAINAPQNDKEEPTNGTSTSSQEEDDRSIKITFDPDDEFGTLNPDVDPNDLLLHDMLVSPRTWNEKGYFNSRHEFLRVKGDPEGRVGPYDRRDPQATAILGASCYSAAAEIIKATFLDGHVVVFKPHPYNAEVDKVWAEIMKPLVEVGAVSYCQANQGPDLVKDPRIDQIYMTGSEDTAHEIRKHTEKPCVLQTGGVNPVIMVPSLDRPWKPKELRHHALQIATAARFNGGHFCGRPQVLVTSKSWDQREEFLEELKEAFQKRTPPEASYDPKYRKAFDRFVQEYPDGNVIEADDVDTDAARVFLVTGASDDSYGLRHEAFCQVLIEVALDIPDHPVAFLPEAVKFCNEKLFGSLCATIVVDDITNKQYHGIVHQALTDLNYGTVSTNAMACVGWFNPSLYWGSYKSDDANAKAKGVGHFGNLMGYENAVKSIIIDNFCGQGHFIKTCRGAYADKMASLSHYALEPTWKKVTAYKLKGVRAAAARRDW